MSADATGPTPSGKPNLPTSAELKEQVRSLTLRIRKAHLERAVKLLESNPVEDWVSQYVNLLDRYRDGQALLSPISTPNDRRYGRNFPLFQTEQDLAILRAPARILCAANSYAIGLVGGLTSYVVGTGYTYRAVAKKGVKREVPDSLLAACNDVLDEFQTRTLWCELEQELFWRSREDGEYFLRHFLTDEGVTEVRTVEPEQILQPPGAHQDEWSFGVRTDPDDVQKPISYWVSYLRTTPNGVEVPAAEMVHCKVNTKRSIKRGMTDFCFDTLDALDQSAKLRRNLTLGAAVQAAIAGIRQHTSASLAQASAFQQGLVEYSQADPVTGRQADYQRIAPGTILDMGKDTNFVPPPSDESGGTRVAILQASLRGAAVRWNAPEWLGSSDASNNNFASSLTAESPFVLGVKRAQRSTYDPRYKQTMQTVLANAATAGRLPRDVLDLVDVQAEAPSPEARNTLQEAQTDQIWMQAGIKSVQTCSQEQGLDYEQEQQNIQQHADEYGQPAGGLPMPGEGPPGGPPGGPGGGGAGAAQPGQSDAAAQGQGDEGDPFAALLPESLLLEACVANRSGRGHHDDRTGAPCSTTGTSGSQARKKAKRAAAGREGSPAAQHNAGIVAKMKAGLEAAKAQAGKAAAKLWQMTGGHLPEGAQRTVKRVATLALGAYHAMEEPRHRVVAMAKEVARQRGASPQHVERAAKLLAVVDFAEYWSGAGILAAHQGLHAAGIEGVVGLLASKAGMMIPVAGLAYLGGELAAGLAGGKNPLKLLAAAYRATGGHAHGSHEAMEGDADRRELVAELLDNLGRGEWYEVLVYAALDQTHDLREALDLAEQAWHDSPDGPPEGGDGPDGDLPEGWEGVTRDDLVSLLEAAPQHAPGERWQGPSGRWFTKLPSGRVVPAKGTEEEHKAGVDAAHEHVQGHLSRGHVSAEHAHELAGKLLKLNLRQLADLKKRLGLKASGPKFEMAAKLATRALAGADGKPKSPRERKPDPRAQAHDTLKGILGEHGAGVDFGDPEAVKAAMRKALGGEVPAPAPAPEPKLAEPAKPPTGEPTDHHAAVAKAVQNLAGKGGLVSLADLSDATGLRGEALHQAVNDLRRKGLLAASAGEGRHGIPAREREAGIPDVGGNTLTHVSPREGGEAELARLAGGKGEPGEKPGKSEAPPHVAKAVDAVRAALAHARSGPLDLHDPSGARREVEAGIHALGLGRLKKGDLVQVAAGVGVERPGGMTADQLRRAVERKVLLAFELRVSADEPDEGRLAPTARDEAAAPSERPASSVTAPEQPAPKEKTPPAAEKHGPAVAELTRLADEGVAAMRAHVAAPGEPETPEQQKRFAEAHREHQRRIEDRIGELTRDMSHAELKRFAKKMGFALVDQPRNVLLRKITDKTAGRLGSLARSLA